MTTSSSFQLSPDTRYMLSFLIPARSSSSTARIVKYHICQISHMSNITYETNVTIKCNRVPSNSPLDINTLIPVWAPAGFFVTTAALAFIFLVKNVGLSLLASASSSPPYQYLQSKSRPQQDVFAGVNIGSGQLLSFIDSRLVALILEQYHGYQEQGG